MDWMRLNWVGVVWFAQKDLFRCCCMLRYAVGMHAPWCDAEE
jgi:hypothetical protein